jgi:hypothetical protein
VYRVFPRPRDGRWLRRLSRPSLSLEANGKRRIQSGLIRHTAHCSGRISIQLRVTLGTWQAHGCVSSETVVCSIIARTGSAGVPAILCRMTLRYLVDEECSDKNANLRQLQPEKFVIPTLAVLDPSPALWLNHEVSMIDLDHLVRIRPCISVSGNITLRHTLQWTAIEMHSRYSLLPGCRGNFMANIT